MRKFTLTSILTLSLLGACDSAPTVPARLALAEVCAVAEVAAKPALTEVGPVGEPPIGEPPIGEPPIDEPPTGEPPVAIACCVAESGAAVTCNPMDYDVGDCQAVAEPLPATVLTAYTVEEYTGTEIPNAYFGCETDPNEECEEGDGAYRLQVQGAVAVIEFTGDGNEIRVYDIDDEVVVQTEDGGPLHAVVAAGHSYADPSKPVYVDGALIGYANYQTDWLPNGCGHTGNIC